MKAVCGANEVFTAIEGLRDRGIGVLPFRVELDPYGIGIEVVKKDLNLKHELAFFLLDGRAAKAQHRPVLGELSLPIQQIGSQRSFVLGARRKADAAGK